jgi:hypothetical protein
MTDYQVNYTLQGIAKTLKVIASELQRMNDRLEEKENPDA